MIIKITIMAIVLNVNALRVPANRVANKHPLQRLAHLVKVMHLYVEQNVEFPSAL